MYRCYCFLWCIKKNKRTHLTNEQTQYDRYYACYWNLNRKEAPKTIKCVFLCICMYFNVSNKTFYLGRNFEYKEFVTIMDYISAVLDKNSISCNRNIFFFDLIEQFRFLRKYYWNHSCSIKYEITYFLINIFINIKIYFIFLFEHTK